MLANKLLKLNTHKKKIKLAIVFWLHPGYPVHPSSAFSVTPKLLPRERSNFNWFAFAFLLHSL
jgi:hypothetical protein